MRANPRTEKALDKALADALFERPDFGVWFLSRTKFRGEQSRCVFCRSNNPWGTVRLERPNLIRGELETLAKQCETDVLCVFETEDGRRLALHIENKLAEGIFTPLQPELYRERLGQWENRPKVGRYSDATSVLVAPKAFYEKFRTAADTFEAYVSHEDIAVHIPVFAVD
jgi:hypothetical protein